MAPLVDADHSVRDDLACDDVTPEPEEPDGPMVRLEGIDYQYCKGCMRCIETCPTEAMVKITETPGLADSLRVPLYANG